MPGSMAANHLAVKCRCLAVAVARRSSHHYCHRVDLNLEPALGGTEETKTGAAETWKAEDRPSVAIFAPDPKMVQTGGDRSGDCRISPAGFDDYLRCAHRASGLHLDAEGCDYIQRL